jgi:hypothetical protein
LIQLDQVTGVQHSELVDLIVNELTRVSATIQFAHYRKLKAALQDGNLPEIRGWIDARNANLTGASDIRFIGVNIEKPKKVIMQNGQPVLTLEQQSAGLEACVEAFFVDLEVICAVRKVVLMFDAFERCEPKLADWINSTFLQRLFFELTVRPKLLLMVVAGRQVPPLEKRWPPEEIDAVVSSISQLRKWEREHVEQCLKNHGYHYTPEEVDHFYKYIQKGASPGSIVQLIRDLAGAVPAL